MNFENCAFELFPIKIFKFNIETDLLIRLTSEVLEKKDKIDIISFLNEERSPEIYSTDYQDPIRLESFEDVAEKLEEYFKSENTHFKLRKYWTAIYNKNATHLMHNHFGGVLDKTNYSGILYLSSIGSTTFYSTNPMSMETTYEENSESGKIVMFPSALPHSVNSSTIDGEIRMVVAFNCELYKIV